MHRWTWGTLGLLICTTLWGADFAPLKKLLADLDGPHDNRQPAILEYLNPQHADREARRKELVDALANPSFDYNNASTLSRLIERAPDEIRAPFAALAAERYLSDPNLPAHLFDYALLLPTDARDAFLRKAQQILREGSSAAAHSPRHALAHTLRYYQEDLSGRPMTAADKTLLARYGAIDRKWLGDIAAAPGGLGVLLNLFHRPGDFHDYWAKGGRTVGDRELIAGYTADHLIKSGTKLDARQLETLVSALKDPAVDPSDKEDAMRLLQAQDPARAQGVLQDLSQSPDPKLRLTGAVLLPPSSPERFRQLLELLEQPDLRSLVGFYLQESFDKLPAPFPPAPTNLLTPVRTLLASPDSRGQSLGIRLAHRYGRLAELLPELRTLLGTFPVETNTETLLGAHRSVGAGHAALLDILKTDPALRKALTPSLIAAYRDPKVYDWFKEAALSLLAKDPVPELRDEFLRLIAEPSNPTEPEVGRSAIQTAARGLGQLLRHSPQSLTAPQQQQLRDLMLGNDPTHSVARTYLRQYLPEPFVAEVDGLAARAVLPGNEDPCQVSCRLARKALDELGKTPIPVDAYSSAAGDFEVATGALSARLIVRNAKRCGLADVETVLKRWLLMVNRHLKPSAPTTDSGDARAFLEQQLATLPGGVSPEARAFLDRVAPTARNSTLRSPTGASAFVPPHMNLFVQDARAFGFESVVQGIDTASFDQEAMANLLGAEQMMREGGSGRNSWFPTYHFVVNLMGYQGDPKSGNFKKAFAKLVEAQTFVQDHFGDATRFPYYLPSQYAAQQAAGESEYDRAARETDLASLRAGSLSSAARAVPARLAFFRLGPSEQKTSNADLLLKALKNYDRHFYLLFSGIGENRTHDRYTEEQLAPYFGPSTIPYVFEALQVLTTDPSTTKDQREAAAALVSTLTNKFLSLFKADGSFQSQHPDLYAGASRYDPALAGLALERACALKGTTAPAPRPVAPPMRALDEHALTP